uniref:Uncharacterized protein n=1 Tax=Romanomermis culicivorax TaxID=13658 RepID=A0A915JHQ6_ROMCU
MPTLPDQEVYPFPDTSASLYATTIYLTKSEAKALPGMTTKLIPKNLINVQLLLLTSPVLETRYMVYTVGIPVRGHTGWGGDWIFGNIHNDLTTTYSTVSRTRTELVPTLRSLNGAKFDTNPTDGKVSAVGSQDDRKATSMVMNGKNSPAATTAQPIAEDLSVNLMNPWFTVKQCQSTCLQEIDKNPMPETYQIVAKFMNMFGKTGISGMHKFLPTMQKKERRVDALFVKSL